MVRTESDDEIVRHVQLHAKTVHNMDVNREQALAMAKPVELTIIA
jgi:predicted small metal-binding protein